MPLFTANTLVRGKHSVPQMTRRTEQHIRNIVQHKTDRIASDYSGLTSEKSEGKKKQQKQNTTNMEWGERLACSGHIS